MRMMVARMMMTMAICTCHHSWTTRWRTGRCSGRWRWPSPRFGRSTPCPRWSGAPPGEDGDSGGDGSDGGGGGSSGGDGGGEDGGGGDGDGDRVTIGGDWLDGVVILYRDDHTMQWLAILLSAIECPFSKIFENRRILNINPDYPIKISNLSLLRQCQWMQGVNGRNYCSTLCSETIMLWLRNG